MALEPLIVRVKLTNLGGAALLLDVREDGAPYILESMISSDGTSFTEHAQWLSRVGPKPRRITLAPRESTSGDFLVVFDKRLPGIAFAEPGAYALKLRCRPVEDVEPTYSAVTQLTVSDDAGVNREFLQDLERVAFDFYGYDPEVVERLPAEQRVAGIQLLSRIIDQQRPRSIPAADSPEAKKDTALLASLATLIDRHPKSSYVGYLARYLGLVHLQQFRDTTGLRRGDPSKLAAEPAYQESLRYLAIAEKSDLWPRTTATLNLVGLDALAQEWTKANEHIEVLRTRYSESGGAKLAEDMTAELEKARTRVERQREAGAPTDEAPPSDQKK